MLKIIAIFCFFLLPVQAFSATCSDLASRFAKDQNSLSAEDLTALKRCVDEKVREKHGVQAPTAPIDPPGSTQQQGKPQRNLPSPPPKPGQSQ